MIHLVHTGSWWTHCCRREWWRDRGSCPSCGQSRVQSPAPPPRRPGDWRMRCTSSKLCCRWFGSQMSWRRSLWRCGVSPSTPQKKWAHLNPWKKQIWIPLLHQSKEKQASPLKKKKKNSSHPSNLRRNTHPQCLFFIPLQVLTLLCNSFYSFLHWMPTFNSSTLIPYDSLVEHIPPVVVALGLAMLLSPRRPLESTQ